ncbi:MAG: diacylglycerol kinase family protein [Kouleothrix sp.]
MACGGLAPSGLNERRTAAPARARRALSAAGQPIVTLLASFRYAAAGVRYLLWTQRNAVTPRSNRQQQTGLLGIDRYEWLALLITITIVLATGMNTAVEAAVDLAAPGYHPLAKIAKMSAPAPCC